jgi:hypothetical protein
MTQQQIDNKLNDWFEASWDLWQGGVISEDEINTISERYVELIANNN